MMGQLPIERVTPDSVFNRVEVDYAGPVYIKYGFVCKPTIIKAYVCMFVSLSVKAVDLELVSDLSTNAFIASLRRFVARLGKPILIWRGSNFVGAARELRELVQFLTRISFQSFAPRRIFNEKCFLSMHHTLVAFGSQPSKA